MRPPVSLSHLAYLIVIAIKGIDGAIETALGFLIAIAGPDKFYLSVLTLTRPELVEDHPFAAAAAKAAEHGAAAIAFGSPTFAIFYLLVHGLLKLGIALALITGHRVILPFAVVVFGGFALFLGYRTAIHWSWGTFALVLFDLLTVGLVVQEWRRPQKKSPALRPG
ncbi:MAG TPA: DUF2127 domain-containing protein [Rhizomicrobium sp.]|nr:DUF2127 domain-containing protein [Rhizomicrobium sp.]